ncbi:MAG: hypothetical protein B7Z18_01785, partial [Alishewanella sp. 32-51-5]
HVGDGNFHIIPLVDPKDPTVPKTIDELSHKVYDLVLSYEGSITGEHNDGLIRTPYVEKMFGREMYALFVEVKKIFDPLNIFNPGKKVGGGNMPRRGLGQRNKASKPTMRLLLILNLGW